MLALALSLLALAVRVPYLYLVPRFTDELGEAFVSWLVARGQVTPWFGMVAYYGPAHMDIVALILRIFPNSLAPRVLAMIFGALTIGATYFLGRVLRDRATGIIAALCLGTATTHIVVNSHLAYGNAVTPFFTTLALTWLVLARQKNSSGFLVLAGVSFALAIQTHPVAVALAPGLLLWLLMPRAQWVWFRRPGLYLAALATLATYSPVLILIWLQPKQLSNAVGSRGYAISTDHSLGVYLGNLQGLMVELLRMVGAVYRDLDRPLAYLTDPLTLVYAILVPIATVVALRRGRSILPLALASSALVIPYFNRQYETFPYFTRYVAFLLPLIYTAVAALAVDAWEWLRTRPQFSSTRARQIAAAAAVIVIAVLLAAPLFRTFTYYEQQTRSGRSNALFLNITQIVDATRSQKLLLDKSLEQGEFPSGGNLHFAFQAWFDFENRPFALVNTETSVTSALCSGDKSFLIASFQAADRASANCRVTRMLGYEIPTRPGRDNLSYGLYEISPE